MALNVQLILGPDLMAREKKAEVIMALRALSLSPQIKGYLYGQWARQVGLPVEGEDFARVIAPEKMGK